MFKERIMSWRLPMTGVHAHACQHSIELHLNGMKLVSLANARVHWRESSKLAKEQRVFARRAVIGYLNFHGWRTLPHDQFRIGIIRLGPRALDSDNLAISAKHVRDGIADAIGIDDGSPRIEWIYQQGKGPYGVAISIERYREAA